MSRKLTVKVRDTDEVDGQQEGVDSRDKVKHIVTMISYS